MEAQDISCILSNCSAAKFARESDPPSFFSYPTERKNFLRIQEVKTMTD